MYYLYFRCQIQAQLPLASPVLLESSHMSELLHSLRHGIEHYLQDSLQG